MVVNGGLTVAEVIQKVCRRGRVVRIFPSEESAERLRGALPAEIHVEWQGRRYLYMDEFFDWAERQASAEQMTAAENG